MPSFTIHCPGVRGVESSLPFITPTDNHVELITLDISCPANNMFIDAHGHFYCRQCAEKIVARFLLIKDIPAEFSYLKPNTCLVTNQSFFPTYDTKRHPSVIDLFIKRENFFDFLFISLQSLYAILHRKNLCTVLNITPTRISFNGIRFTPNDILWELATKKLIEQPGATITDCLATVMAKLLGDASMLEELRAIERASPTDLLLEDFNVFLPLGRS